MKNLKHTIRKVTLKVTCKATAPKLWAELILSDNLKQIATFISTDQSQEITEREMLIRNEYIRLYIS